MMTRIFQQEGTFGASTTAILAGTAPKLTQLAGTVHELYNGGISYRTPGGKYYVQLKTNYQGPTTQVNLPATNAAGQQGALTPAYQFWDMEMRVVSVKFCKSGSVVRGFGEIKRFMGRV